MKHAVLCAIAKCESVYSMRRAQGLLTLASTW
jgi:hypothetical protein